MTKTSFKLIERENGTYLTLKQDMDYVEFRVEDIKYIVGLMVTAADGVQ
jgi:tetrahydromethanopterin S-methyltransferase subunit F